MKIRYPITIGKRIFLGHEWLWVGWHSWVFGVDLSYEPTLHLGPWMLTVYED